MKALQLKSYLLWWEVSQYLWPQDKSLWPKFENLFNKLVIFDLKDHLETKKNSVVQPTIVNENQRITYLMNQNSSFNWLNSISVWCLRIRNSCKLDPTIRKNDYYLNAFELQNAIKTNKDCEKMCVSTKNSMLKTKVTSFQKTVISWNKMRFVQLLWIGEKWKFSNASESPKHKYFMKVSLFFKTIDYILQ